jgi:hypothetical protein
MVSLGLVNNYSKYFKPLDRPLFELERRRRDTQAQLARYVADTETRPMYNSELFETGYVSPYMNDIPHEARTQPGQRYSDIWNYIRQHGIVVRCELRWLQSIESHANPGHHLLAFIVEPIPENQRQDGRRNLFPTVRTTNPWSKYHISICYAEDPISIADIRYLLKKFNGKVVHLRIRNEDGDQWRSQGSLSLDPARDPIASDPVVRRLWQNGGERHKVGGIHISL